MKISLRDLFLLDPAVHFLNHGSFGACPRPVFDTYQAWQRRLESQPVLMLGREYDALLQRARQALGAFLHAPADDLVFIPNATYGVNVMAHSLRLAPGDEILAGDHEYGACEYAWEAACKRSGALYIRQPIPLDGSPEEILEALWQGVTARTRVLFLSHISSATALHFPVEAACRRARQAGILTVIDGAHAPGQIPLDLETLGADVYTGNCHKWLMSPKGAAFLYVRPELQPQVEPVVVSWGYHATPEKTSGSRYLDYLTWSGTHDPSAYLTVPAAIDFLRDYDWDAVRADCQALLYRALEGVQTITGLPAVYAPGPEGIRQMAVAELPAGTDVNCVKARLMDEFAVEVPLTEWNGRKFVRISVQGYNTAEDIDALLEGLKACIH